ncbi:hypothetical protein AGMMS49928_09090 [Spirochaetia bacterium]|nr:hypothetical protein AGMMS49928_09090 [Spirochaetia bacterium]
MLDGSAFQEKTAALYGEPGTKGKKGFTLREIRQKDGGEFIIIGHSEFPGLRIKASLPEADGSFYLVSMEFLSSHVAGWNEFTLDLSGSGVFTAGENGGRLEINEMETVQISGGKVRYKDQRLTGREALTALRNRHERINALGEWMRQRENAAAILSEKDFIKRWKPELLPELVKKKEKPAAFTAAADSETSPWVIAEDVRINSAYTRLLFPEELWPLRDSGALIRDWEEALPWVRLYYHWDILAALLKGPIQLER